MSSGSQSRVTVGRIVGPHGICGEIRVFPLTDFPERFRTRKNLWLSQPGVQPGEREVRVEEARPHGRVWVLKLTGVDDRNAAEALRDAELLVEGESLESLDDGRYYVHHLVGLPVVMGDGSEVGRLRDVIQTGAGDVFVIRRGNGPDGKDCLVPARKEFLEIDRAGGRIILSPIPGMIDE